MPRIGIGGQRVFATFLGIADAGEEAVLDVFDADCNPSRATRQREQRTIDDHAVVEQARAGEAVTLPVEQVVDELSVGCGRDIVGIDRGTRGQAGGIGVLERGVDGLVTKDGPALAIIRERTKLPATRQIDRDRWRYAPLPQLSQVHARRISVDRRIVEQNGLGGACIDSGQVPIERIGGAHRNARRQGTGIRFGVPRRVEAPDVELDAAADVLGEAGEQVVVTFLGHHRLVVGRVADVRIVEPQAWQSVDARRGPRDGARTHLDVTDGALPPGRHAGQPVDRMDIVAIPTEHGLAVAIAVGQIGAAGRPGMPHRRIGSERVIVIGEAITRIHLQAIEPSSGDEVDDTANGVAAVERRSTVKHHFHPLQHRGGDDVGIGRRIVDAGAGDAVSVDQHQRRSGAAAAGQVPQSGALGLVGEVHGHRVLPATAIDVGPDGADRVERGDLRNAAEQLVGARWRFLLDIVARQADSGRGLGRDTADQRAGDDDLRFRHVFHFRHGCAEYGGAFGLDDDGAPGIEPVAQARATQHDLKRLVETHRSVQGRRALAAGQLGREIDLAIALARNLVECGTQILRPDVICGRCLGKGPGWNGGENHSRGHQHRSRITDLSHHPLPLDYRASSASITKTHEGISSAQLFAADRFNPCALSTSEPRRQRGSARSAGPRSWLGRNAPGRCS